MAAGHLSFLYEPFPGTCDPRRVLRSISFASLVVVGFFLLLSPFGFDRFTFTQRLFFSFSFGGITFVAAGVYNLFTLGVLKLPKDKPQWTFGYWLLDVAALILLISLANHFFMQWIQGHGFSWAVLGRHIVATFVVGIIPTAISGFVASFQALRKNQQLAATVPTPDQTPKRSAIPLQLPSTQTSEALTVASQALLYAEAMENYVALFVYEEGVVKREIVRNTLGNIEAALPDAFFRCHRSFIVNLQHITQVQGNAQGLKLSLTYGEAIVPVSRKYITAFRTLRETTKEGSAA